MALPDFSKFKAPYRFVPEKGGFRLYKNGVRTETSFRSMQDAKKKVLALNNTWRASPAGRKASPKKAYNAQGRIARANPAKKHYEGSPYTSESQPYPVKDVRAGEFVKRKPGARKTYRVEGYDRTDRLYVLQDTDDISRSLSVKGSTLVYFGD